MRLKAEPEIPKKYNITQIQIGDDIDLYFTANEEGYKGTNTTKVTKKTFKVTGKYPAGMLLERNGSREFLSYWEIEKRLNPPDVTVDNKNHKVYRWGVSVL